MNKIQSSCGTIEAAHHEDGQTVMSHSGRGLYWGNTRGFWGDVDRDYVQAVPDKPFIDFSAYKTQEEAVKRLDDLVIEYKDRGIIRKHIRL